MRSSARALNRIMIATLNVGHRGGTLNCTVRRMGNSTLLRTHRAGLTGTLANGISNIRVVHSDGNPNNSSGVRLHNTGSMANLGRPLVIISNIPVSGFAKTDGGSVSGPALSVNGKLSSVGTRSVRSVSILGNTSTTTLCNSHTNGNIVLVAAGGKAGHRNLNVAVSNSISTRAAFVLPGHRGTFKRNRGNIFSSAGNCD